MTWSRFDDLYDEHEKIEDAWDRDRATVGLHAMATTACNRWLSDGVIRPRWLKRKLPDDKERARLLDVMVDVELFDLLPAGEARAFVDDDGNDITLGPFTEDRYLVHDFLDRHHSSLMVKAKRAKDAARQRARRQTTDSDPNPSGVRADTAGTPDGDDGDSDESPRLPRAPGPVAAGARGRIPSLPVPTQVGTDVPPSGAKAPERRPAAPSKRADPDELPDELPEALALVAAKALRRLNALQTIRGGHVPTLRGVGLALRRFPQRDHMATIEELEHWATVGRGQGQQIKDWTRTLATFLERAPAGAPVRAMAAAGRHAAAPTTRLLEERHPTDPDDAAAAIWRAAEEALRARVGDDHYDIHLACLHVHGLDDDTLVLAGEPGPASWAADRFTNALAECVDQPVRVVTCIHTREAAPSAA